MVLGELGGREFDLRKITDHLSQVGFAVFFPIGIKHLEDVKLQHRPIQLNQVAVNRQLQLNLRVALIQLGIGKNHRLLQVDEHQAGPRIPAGTSLELDSARRRRERMRSVEARRKRWGSLYSIAWRTFS